MNANYCREQARTCRDTAVAEANQTDRGRPLYMAGVWDRLGAIKDTAPQTNDNGEIQPTGNG